MPEPSLDGSLRAESESKLTVGTIGFGRPFGEQLGRRRGLEQRRGYSQRLVPGPVALPGCGD